MIAFWAIAALLVPWGFGVAVVHVLRDRRSSWAAVVGTGWLVGQVVMMAALYAALVMLGASHARIILALVAAAAIGIAWWSKMRPHRSNALDRLRTQIDASDASLPSAPRQWCTAFFATFVAASLLIKLYCLIGSHAAISTRCDDAISIWLFKAKVITVLNELPMDPAHDYYMAGSNTHYPIFPSLTAAWLPLIAGRWHEQLATLPWLFTGMSLFLLVGGSLRRWLPAMPSWLAAYLVASLPLMVIHVYRPGYADLPLSAFLAGAVLSMLSWRSSQHMPHLLLGGLMLLATACMKREGAAIACITTFCFAITSWRWMIDWPRHTRWLVVGAMVLAIVIVLTVVDFSEQAETAAELGYHPEAWKPLEQHAFEWSSFQFLFWGVALAWLVVVFHRHAPHRTTSALLTLGLCGFVVGIFVFTSQVRFAMNDQTPSRILLQIAPAIVIALAISLFSSSDPICRQETHHGGHV